MDQFRNGGFLRFLQKLAEMRVSNTLNGGWKF
jgi:hypothetical protein